MTLMEKLFGFLQEINANKNLVDIFKLKLKKDEIDEARKYFLVHGFYGILKEKKSLFGTSYEMWIESKECIKARQKIGLPNNKFQLT